MLIPFSLYLSFTSSDREKSTISLWKLITFYPNKQIWPEKWLNSNYLIMITLNLFELNWWDSLWDINVLKSVNKLYFGQNYKKVGKFFFIFFYFYIYFSNPEKYYGQISPGNSEKQVPFPRIEVLLMQKKLSVLFPVGGSMWHFN